jgi:hypothetical protein
MSEWIKASMSGDQGSCVEVRLREADVDVRDTKDRSRRPFTVRAGAWEAFLQGVRDGEFG